MKKAKTVLVLFLMLHIHTFLLAQDGLTESQIKSIENLIAPLRTKMEKVLQADQTGTYKQYLAELENVKKMTDYSRQKATFSQMEAKYLGFLKAAFAKAGIDEVDYRSKVALIIPKGVLYTFGNFLGIISTGRSAASCNTTTSNGSIDLACPMSNANGTERKGILISHGEATAAGCNFKAAGTQLIVGSGTATAQLGGNAIIPANNSYSSWKVDATAPGTYHLGGIALACGGGSYVESRIGMSFMDKYNQRQTFTYRILWSIAPIIFCVSYDETLSAISQCTGASPSGGTYLIQAFGKAYVSGAGIAGSSAISEGTIEKIQVCYQR